MKNFIKRYLAQRQSVGLQFGSGAQISQSRFGGHVRVGRDAIVIASNIGDYSYVEQRTTVAHATIGRFCSIGPDVTIGAGSHPSRRWVSTHPIFYQARPNFGWSLTDRDRFPEFCPTKIGNDVWVGARALLRDGVVIGDGAIIAGGAIVVTDVEPYSIYGGVPARMIRRRFDDEQIAYLLDLKWWDRDLDWLRTHADMFSDIDELRETTDRG